MKRVLGAVAASLVAFAVVALLDAASGGADSVNLVVLTLFAVAVGVVTYLRWPVRRP